MLGILMDGGWMMLPLVLCSVIAVAIIIDRARAFRRFLRRRQAILLDSRNIPAQQMRQLAGMRRQNDRLRTVLHHLGLALQNGNGIRIQHHTTESRLNYTFAVLALTDS